MFFYTLLYSSFLFFFVLLLFASACVCAVFWVWFLPIYSAENTCSSSAVSFAAFFVRNSSAAGSTLEKIWCGILFVRCIPRIPYFVSFATFFSFFFFFHKKYLTIYMYTLYGPNIKQKRNTL